MKFVKTIGILLLFALLASTAAATTENKDMPTEKEVTAFVDNFNASGDFANSSYDAFIEQFPAGHCDIWSDGMISFYYYDPSSPKEYGAIYLDSTGKEAKMSCRAGITPVKSYKGENKTEVKEDTKVETINVSEDQKEQVKEDNEDSITLPDNVTIQAINNTSIPENVKNTPEPVIIMKNDSGTVTNQGNNDPISQIFIDISKLKDCSINFFSSDLGGN